MIFSSSVFLFLFLPMVLLGYFLIRVEYRNIFLLIVSLAFYGWGEPRFIFVMCLSIGINYIAGLIIHYGKMNCGKVCNRIILICAVMVNLIILFYFKYLDFFIESINTVTGSAFPLKNIVLPIGISFFTFQGMSYILDLYMDKVEVQKKLINIALYIALFPQLIAGPIVRYKDINEQINFRECKLDKFVIGIRRFVVGLGKKVVIANNLGLIADQIFANNPLENSMAIAWLGIICYTIQIYFDFSGYSDMAIGLGKMFGFDFLENFNYPYISTSITEFWRRWHISLSSWFRDYVYIPLGGNRRGNMYFNLLVVFLVTGLWHGAAWNFVIWGLWHGMFLIIEKMTKQKNIHFKMPKSIKWLFTMIIVMIGWILFRAPSLKFAVEYVGVMFGALGVKQSIVNLGWYLSPFIIIVLGIALIGAMNFKRIFNGMNEQLEGTYLKEGLINIYIIVLFLICIVCVMTSTYNPFIYFRF